MRNINLNQPSTASKETPREINRRVVLNFIRSNQPISRADLARRSGLQRSTVSLIVEELIADKWVIEGPLGRLPRGRRPTFLRLNDQRVVACVDIRPLRTTLGFGNVTGAFTSVDTIPTPPDPSIAVEELGGRIRSLVNTRRDLSFEGIGISVPGRVDLLTHRLVFAPNLKWPITDIKGPLERETGLEVQAENAANACALSEMWFSTSDEIRDLVAITVSEGIGAGIIAQGHLISGRRGMAGEFGHVPLERDGPPCSCGNRGCWEVLASNRAALRYYFESHAQGPASHADDFGFQDLLQLAETGEVLANRALTRMAVQIGRGTRMVVAGLAPETILFIGEFTALWDRFRPVIEAEVQAQSISPEPTILLAAKDGATARVRGTIALVLQKHFAAPSSVMPISDSQRA
ncbi:MAG: ROK family transcriptional regulator [Acidobacteriaceae bacterium]|nr:ROK family transcriptional regulator [Acidobacteriaceae bacterium]MBV9781500.1 ROK family transcriptional regulator [Acidobacteriaceae bacterium]